MKYQRLFGFTVVLSSILILSCQSGWDGETRDFRQDMRDFVQRISTYSHAQDSDLIIIPQNGHSILIDSGLSSSSPDPDYIAAIDGVGREDLFYSYNRDDEATPSDELSDMLAFMTLAVANGLQVLTTDYCSTFINVEDSYSQNA
ncbi:MAG: hypothetical protein PF447_09240 [Spirochaetaceae bacterium]|jgi:cysteinyl-tRNA synthetase|nr:hypothetical protein [Spirochaetaceae bacterium]